MYVCIMCVMCVQNLSVVNTIYIYIYIYALYICIYMYIYICMCIYNICVIDRQIYYICYRQIDVKLNLLHKICGASQLLVQFRILGICVISFILRVLGLRVARPKSQDPSARVPSVRVPCPRIRGSRTSGPDFRLCHNKVTISKL